MSRALRVVDRTVCHHARSCTFFACDHADRRSLSGFVAKWKEWTSKYGRIRLGYTSPLWQPEFFDHVLRSSVSYEEKWVYVRNNPVRAGLVQSADEWKYQGEIVKLHPD